MNEVFSCPACQETRPAATMHSGLFLTDKVAEQIQKIHPGWTQEQAVCQACVLESKAMVVQEVLTEEMGELTPLDEDVIESVRKDTFVTVNEYEADEHPSIGQQLAHRITAMIGNWYFPLTIAIFLLCWLLLNILLRPFSPYPMIVVGVMSALLASLAALQGPIIIMSQRAQQKRDRLRADNEYRVNLKAEMEIRYIDEKVEKLMQMQQQMQKQILGEIQRRDNEPL